MFFPRKNWTFRQIHFFRPKRDLSSFLHPFWPLGTACGSLLAPHWVSLALLGLQNSLLGRLQDALGPLQVPSWTLKIVAGAHFGSQSGPKAAGKLIFEVPVMDFCYFSQDFDLHPQLHQNSFLRFR